MGNVQFDWPFAVIFLLAVALAFVIRYINRCLAERRTHFRLDAWVDASDILLTHVGFKEKSSEQDTYSLDWIDCDPCWNEHVLNRFRSKGYFVYTIVDVHKSPDIDPTHTHIMFYGVAGKHVTFKLKLEVK